MIPTRSPTCRCGSPTERIGLMWELPGGRVRGTASMALPRNSATFGPFRPVRNPSLPKVKNEAWAKSAIDRFVLARLEAQGLRSAGSADKLTLLRRAYFDLVGLPPTPEEVGRFSSRHLFGSLRHGDRPAVGIQALRRALGTTLARCRSIFGRPAQFDQNGALPRRLSISRLGHRGV